MIKSRVKLLGILLLSFGFGNISLIGSATAQHQGSVQVQNHIKHEQAFIKKYQLNPQQIIAYHQMRKKIHKALSADMVQQYEQDQQHLLQVISDEIKSEHPDIKTVHNVFKTMSHGFVSADKAVHQARNEFFETLSHKQKIHYLNDQLYMKGLLTNQAVRTSKHFSLYRKLQAKLKLERKKRENALIKDMQLNPKQITAFRQVGAIQLKAAAQYFKQEDASELNEQKAIALQIKSAHPSYKSIHAFDYLTARRNNFDWLKPAEQAEQYFFTTLNLSQKRQYLKLLQSRIINLRKAHPEL